MFYIEVARIEAVPSGLEHINPKTVFGFAFPEELLLEQTRSDMNRRQLARYNFAADASPPPHQLQKHLELSFASSQIPQWPRAVQRSENTH